MSIVMFDLLDVFEGHNLYFKSNLFDFFAYRNASYPLPDQARDIGYDGINAIIMQKTIAFIQFY